MSLMPVTIAAVITVSARIGGCAVSSHVIAFLPSIKTHQLYTTALEYTYPHTDIHIYANVVCTTTTPHTRPHTHTHTNTHTHTHTHPRTPLATSLPDCCY